MNVRVCNNCGNIYSKKAGMKLVTKCPVCNSVNKKELFLDEGSP